MANVYILYSESLDKYYVGSCINLTERLVQHNEIRSDGSFTSRAQDWGVFWEIEVDSQESARLIEAHIKRMKSRRYYQSLKNYPEIAEKLILKYAGSSR